MQAAQALEAYGQPGSQLIVKLDKTEFDALLAERSIGVSVPGEPDLRIIDRRLAGDDWLMRPAPLVSNPSRLIFYSVKGGVGRSTALAIAAADLAAKGFNVLVVNLDLEAPGLGALLLPAEWSQNTAWPTGSRQPQPVRTQALIADMTGSSPFTSGGAVVDVVPAAGRRPGAYLSKLARAYAPGSAGDRYARCSFPKKADSLLNQLASHSAVARFWSMRVPGCMRPQAASFWDSVRKRCYSVLTPRRPLMICGCCSTRLPMPLIRP